MAVVIGSDGFNKEDTRHRRHGAFGSGDCVASKRAKSMADPLFDYGGKRGQVHFSRMTAILAPFADDHTCCGVAVWLSRRLRELTLLSSFPAALRYEGRG